MSRKTHAAGARGFTLIELMVVVAVSAGVSTAAYAVYNAQQISFQRQAQIVEMQQNIRAFLYFIEKDLRMAGFDPKTSGAAGFVTARPAEIVFTADLGRPRGDSACGDSVSCDSMPDGKIISSACDNCIAETIRYSLRDTPAYSTATANYGEVPIGSTTSVTKTFNGSTSTGAQDVIDGVEAIEFLYNMSDGTAATTITGPDLKNIRSVTVSMLIRTRNIVMGHRENSSYYFPASNVTQAASGNKWGPFNDGYMRRLVTTNILCRNMGLQPPT